MIELMVAIGLLATLIMMTLVFVASNQQQVILNEDRALAVQKAGSMLAELRGVAENPTTVDASTLDAYDDGAGTSFVLCADKTVVNPGHEASGNVWMGTRWRYARRITIRKFTNLESRDVRIATVRVYLTNELGTNDAITIADVASVINTNADTFPPSQVYDTYLLAIENVPGWWVYMSYIKPFIENALDDLQSRQPGLIFRRHWITKSGYGRDVQYAPYFNKAADSNADINWAYFYPGTMPAGSAVDQYYVPGSLTARARVDGAIVNDYNAATNPFPYALADQYNHAMRAPQEQALWTARVGAGLDPADGPTYRLLLDDMIRNPDNYRNAIFINLHGELVPFPPIRNYADPAKEPVGRPKVRVVTHPEKLRFVHTDNLRFFVYGYYEDATAAGADFLNTPISVFIPQANFTTPGDVTIAAIRGGTNQDPGPPDATPDVYAVVSPAPTTAGVGGTVNRMYQTTAFVNIGGTPGTLIQLFNTPLRTPYTADTRGLNSGAAPANNWRLYGNEYIPCPCEAAPGPYFTRNLTTVGNFPKNTMRWQIQVAAAAANREWGAGVDRVINLQTRIGVDQTTGTMWPVANQPTNLSTAYCWRSNNANFVPFSERYQYQGDPRHEPYSDVKAANGYNWFFDNLRDASANQIANWPGFDAARTRNSLGNDYDGWHGSGANGTGSDSSEIDVPRCFQFLRTALCETNSIYTTLTGFSYYYMGNGNEIGYDSANGFANSIPVSRKPFDGGSGTRSEDSITTAFTGGVKYVREFNPLYWWSKPWLGELYPDMNSTNTVNVYSTQWAASGNLLTPTGAANQPGRFVRIRRQDVHVGGVAPSASANSLPSGTTFNDHTTIRRLNSRGCVSFMNIGTTAATFRHEYRDNTTGNANVGATQLDQDYNFPIPTNTKISRPFRLDYNTGAGGVGDEFSMADYMAPNRCSALNTLTYYSHQDGTPPWLGSAIIRLEAPSDSTPGALRRAFIAVNGIDRTVETGSAFIATYSTLTLIQTFLAGGLEGAPPATVNRVTQVPQVVIVTPNDTTELTNPASITVQWTTNWLRWDGKKYTASYPNPPPGFSESDGVLRYTLLYSADNGKTWLYMDDDSPATPGAPNMGLLHNDLNANAGESYTWDVAALVEASYLIRVEAYRSNNPLHYSFHEQKIFINR